MDLDPAAVPRGDPDGTAARLDGIPVFCNPASGSAGMEDRLRASLEAAGVSAELHRTAPDDLAAAIQAAVAAGVSLLGVSGGDGSISTAAQALAGSRTILAVFPGGTLNHFARALGVPDHETAARALARRSVVEVDLGEVNGRAFINGVSFGIYPRTLRLRRSWEPRLGKWPAALIAAIRAVSEYPNGPLWTGLVGSMEARYPLVWVGAGRGSFRSPRLKPRELDSGVLELVVLSSRSRMELMRMAGRTLRRGLNGVYACADTQRCTVRYADEFEVAEGLPPSIDAGIDGELVRLDAPLHFRLRRRALRVIAARLASE